MGRIGRWRIALVPLVLGLTGCAQTGPGPLPPGLLPPSVLVDKSATGTLQVYVHAKQGNVRYDFINFTAGNESIERRIASYGLESVLNTTSSLLNVSVVEGRTSYHWEARVTLNETARPATAFVERIEGGRVVESSNETLPFERFLTREERP